MCQHVIFDEYQDAMVHLDPKTKLYRYYIGMETSYRTAVNIQEALQARGFQDAKIIALMDGRLLTRSDILDYAGEYPDLLDFLEQF